MKKKKQVFFQPAQTEEEKKKRIRNIIITAVVLVIAAVACYFAMPKNKDLSQSSIFDKAEVEALAEQVVDYILMNYLQEFEILDHQKKFFGEKY